MATPPGWWKSPSPTEAPGDLFYTVNYSPTFDDPLARLYLRGRDIESTGVSSFLQQLDAYPTDGRNRAVAIHVISPAVSFLDKGKSTLSIKREPTLGGDIGSGLNAAGRVLLRDKKHHERNGARIHRKGTGGNRRRSPADVLRRHARCDGSCLQQWSVRRSHTNPVLFSGPLIQVTAGRSWPANTLQDILVQYQVDHGPLEGLVREARGALREPHPLLKFHWARSKSPTTSYPSSSLTRSSMWKRRGLTRSGRSTPGRALRHGNRLGKRATGRSGRELFARAEGGTTSSSSSTMQMLRATGLPTPSLRRRSGCRIIQSKSSISVFGCRRRSRVWGSRDEYGKGNSRSGCRTGSPRQSGSGSWVSGLFLPRRRSGHASGWS